MKYFILIVLVFTISEVSFGQVVPPSKPIDVDPVSDRSTVLVLKPSTIVLSSNKDYLVGQNDVLAVKIEDAPELTGKYRLNSKGYLILSIVGKIEAEGKTIEEITRIITARLKGGYLVHPIVTVRVEQSNTRAFFIQGAVLRPGTYQIEGNVSLLKLIAIAGGLKDDHGPKAVVMRDRGFPGESCGSANQSECKILRIKVNELYNDLEKNIIIQPGDIVNIPLAERFFIGGEVRNPGSFAIKDSMTLLQAIALAGGLTANAGSRIFITRKKDRKEIQKPVERSLAMNQLGEGDFKIVHVDVDKLMSGDLTKNLVIKPRDLIQIVKAGLE